MRCFPAPHLDSITFHFPAKVGADVLQTLEKGQTTCLKSSAGVRPPEIHPGSDHRRVPIQVVWPLMYYIRGQTTWIGTIIPHVVLRRKNMPSTSCAAPPSMRKACARGNLPMGASVNWMQIRGKTGKQVPLLTRRWGRPANCRQNRYRYWPRNKLEAQKNILTRGSCSALPMSLSLSAKHPSSSHCKQRWHHWSQPELSIQKSSIPKCQEWSIRYHFIWFFHERYQTKLLDHSGVASSFSPNSLLLGFSILS